MTQEQKAKRYEEAIKVAKSNYETIVQMDNDCTFAKEGIVNTFHHIFPELKESEDERYKSAIRKMYSFLPNKPKYIGDVSVEDMFAWLEKQGEQKSHEERIDEINRKVFPNHYGGYAPVLETEHKPADKVEPRFKVGDWITNGIDVCKIKNIDLNEFNYISENGISDISLVDNISHLWTIEDAKDGDVLVDDSCIFIIQKLGDNSTAAKTYYTLYNDGDFDDGSILYFDIDSTKPATKEQRDTLERAMTNAGYEWDADKKELKKIRYV